MSGEINNEHNNDLNALSNKMKKMGMNRIESISVQPSLTNNTRGEISCSEFLLNSTDSSIVSYKTYDDNLLSLPSTSQVIDYSSTMSSQPVLAYSTATAPYDESTTLETLNQTSQVASISGCNPFLLSSPVIQLSSLDGFFDPLYSVAIPGNEILNLLKMKNSCEYDYNVDYLLSNSSGEVFLPTHLNNSTTSFDSKSTISTHSSMNMRDYYQSNNPIMTAGVTQCEYPSSGITSDVFLAPNIPISEGIIPGVGLVEDNKTKRRYRELLFQKGKVYNKCCDVPGCIKLAQASTPYCIRHGGGKRCVIPGCLKASRDGTHCAGHGGGRRCQAEGCTKSAIGGSPYCSGHGGGRQCRAEGCTHLTQSNSSLCAAHGGGKRCTVEGCEKMARGTTGRCAAHGGGKRCVLTECNRPTKPKSEFCSQHHAIFGVETLIPPSISSSDPITEHPPAL